MSRRPDHIGDAEAFQRAIGVSRETLDRLETYDSLLKTWQRTINLVAPSTLEDAWHRHFADSAQLLAFGCVSRESGPYDSSGSAGEKASAPRSWLDLGSGGGFPGLVLAILLAERDPGARMTLVESDSRKAAFLGEVARKTGVTVEIRTERSEKFATQAKSRIRDVITARALAPLPKLLGIVLPFFSPQTVAVFPKGRDVAAELAEAARAFRFDATTEASLTDAEARIVILRNLAVKSEG
jgi:16S rRNA (guanine527-N7)-methyltransferase